MNTKKLKSLFEIPLLGLGTWKIGGEREADFSNDNKNIDDIKRVIDNGIKLIDTAEIYGNGHTEELIGKAIKNYNRKDLFITSKVFRKNLKYNDLIKSCEGSLERLGTDYLDLYLIHAPNPEIDLEETMNAMNYLYEKGFIKNIGVSNFSKETLEKAQNLSKVKIVLNQCHYNLIYREPEISGLNEYCVKNDIIMQAWRPLQYGDFLTKNNEILEKLSKKYNKTYSQIILNWVISQNNITTITKMSKEEHIKENLGAIGWKMEQEDIEFLRLNFPNQEKIGYIPLA